MDAIHVKTINEGLYGEKRNPMIFSNLEKTIEYYEN